jgi:putative FmdB family regulatory protein
MPIYDYACSDCGRFTAVRPLREFDRPTACPECGREAPRALSAPALLGRAARRGDGSASESGSYARLGHGGGCQCCS